jgi:hypothetical protein
MAFAWLVMSEMLPRERGEAGELVFAGGEDAKDHGRRTGDKGGLMVLLTRVLVPFRVKRSSRAQFSSAVETAC